MFDNIISKTRYCLNGHVTDVFLDLNEDGVKYAVHFTVRESRFTYEFVEMSSQVVARVFAIPAHRMAGRKHGAWADTLRYDCVKASQHLPHVLETV